MKTQHSDFLLPCLCQGAANLLLPAVLARLLGQHGTVVLPWAFSVAPPVPQGLAGLSGHVYLYHSDLMCGCLMVAFTWSSADGCGTVLSTQRNISVD